jgi:hypothetical protein
MDLRKSVEVKWPGREELTLEVELDAGGRISKAAVRGIGSPQFLRMLQDLRTQLPGHELKSLKIPEGATREIICVREALLKLKGEWNFPYKEDEVCHCRAVPTEVVDQPVDFSVYGLRHLPPRCGSHHQISIEINK